MKSDLSKITLEMAKGFGLFAMRTILSGEGDQILEVAETNLRQPARE
jgi:pyruvate dehydrogenase (quinone)